MPRLNTIRERLIRTLLSEKSINRRVLERRFNTSDRPQVLREISKLLSEGLIILTGGGTRKMPYTLHRSPIWPFHEKCGLCGQNLPLELVILSAEEKT